jgi:hypothetical protein
MNTKPMYILNHENFERSCNNFDNILKIVSKTKIGFNWRTRMKETELFLPVKHLFESLGFEVEAEIEHIDIIAKKEDRWIAIELKKELNVHVIAQILKRQTLTDEGYIAIMKPSSKSIMALNHLKINYLS